MVAFKLAWALANKFSTPGKLDPHLRQFMLNATSLVGLWVSVKYGGSASL